VSVILALDISQVAYVFCFVFILDIELFISNANILSDVFIHVFIPFVK